MILFLCNDETISHTKEIYDKIGYLNKNIINIDTTDMKCLSPGIKIVFSSCPASNINLKQILKKVKTIILNNETGIGYINKCIEEIIDFTLLYSSSINYSKMNLKNNNDGYIIDNIETGDIIGKFAVLIDDYVYPIFNHKSRKVNIYLNSIINDKEMIYVLKTQCFAFGNCHDIVVINKSAYLKHKEYIKQHSTSQNIDFIKYFEKNNYNIKYLNEIFGYHDTNCNTNDKVKNMFYQITTNVFDNNNYRYEYLSDILRKYRIVTCSDYLGICGKIYHNFSDEKINKKKNEFFDK